MSGWMWFVLGVVWTFLAQWMLRLNNNGRSYSITCGTCRRGSGLCHFNLSTYLWAWWHAMRSAPCRKEASP